MNRRHCTGDSSSSPSDNDPSFEGSDDEESQLADGRSHISKKNSKKSKVSSKNTRQKPIPDIFADIKSSSQPIDVNPETTSDPSDQSEQNLYTTSPQGTPCRFIPIEELAPIIFHPDKYLLPGETGINTMMPGFDPMNKDQLKYFLADHSIITTDLTEIAQMTDESLREQIEWADEELELLPVDEENLFSIVTGLDERIEGSLAIVADVLALDWDEIGSHCQFDVVLMDPPWPVHLPSFGSPNGSALEYMTVQTNDLASMQIPKIQSNGYCFMWVVMSFFSQAVDMMLSWGYTIDGIGNWIKMGPSGRVSTSNAYYVQHGKETLLVGRKGTPPPCSNLQLFQDIIYSQRNPRQSHKPEELYSIIENMFPDCMYLEIFARSHNLRNGWVSIGIQAK